MTEEKLDDVISDIGDFIEYWGFKKIHGRVWGLIYLTDGPISTPDIVEKLNVSKGLVSLAINELLEYNLIQKVGQVKHGGFTYESAQDLAKVVRDVIRNRELVLLSQIEDKLRDLDNLKLAQKSELKISPSRLRDLKVLTSNHKKIAKKLCSIKISSLQDWINFMKNLTRFL